MTEEQITEIIDYMRYEIHSTLTYIPNVTNKHLVTLYFSSAKELNISDDILINIYEGCIQLPEWIIENLGEHNE